MLGLASQLWRIVPRGNALEVLANLAFAQLETIHESLIEVGYVRAEVICEEGDLSNFTSAGWVRLRCSTMAGVALPWSHHVIRGCLRSRGRAGRNSQCRCPKTPSTSSAFLRRAFAMRVNG